VNLFPQEHVEIIDRIWKEVIEFRPYDTPVARTAPIFRRSWTRSPAALP
jgi:hypothetical protein